MYDAYVCIIPITVQPVLSFDSAYNSVQLVEGSYEEKDNMVCHSVYMCVLIKCSIHITNIYLLFSISVSKHYANAE